MFFHKELVILHDEFIVDSLTHAYRVLGLIIYEALETTKLVGCVEHAISSVFQGAILENPPAIFEEHLGTLDNLLGYTSVHFSIELLFSVVFEL